MRHILALALLAFASCVSNPPQPCTTCGDVCVDTKTDSANCGACGTACTAGQVCTDSQCKDTCPAGETKCGTQCVDLKRDHDHCGACTNACSTGEMCGTNGCTADCASPLTVCGSACVDTKTDPQNCSGCGMTCAGGACVNSMCAVTCDTPNTVCTGKCVNANTDPTNCGTCGHDCMGGVCVSGQCHLTCGAPFAECASGCKDITADTANCGGCGMACSPLHVNAALCTASSCGFDTCAPGFVDCDGVAANGCETAVSNCMQLVSVAMDGGPANGRSYGADIDNSGKHVIFISEASNLVPNDTNGQADVFVRDLANNTTTRLSVLPDGGEVKLDAGQTVFANSFGTQVAVSGDGRVYAILTSAPLVAPDTNGGGNDIVVFDNDGGRGYGMLGLDAGQPQGNTEAEQVFLSADGRFVTYSTRASPSLIPPGQNEFNVFRYDRSTKSIAHESPNSGGGYVNGGAVGFNAFYWWATSNGRYMGYNTFGYNVNGPDTACSHAYMRDEYVGFTLRETTDNNGVSLPCVGGTGSGGNLTMSDDGTVLALNTDHLGAATNQVYVRDVATQKWTLVSVALDGGAVNAQSFGPELSGDGRELVFASQGSNLTNDTPNDAGANCYAREANGRIFRLNAPPAMATPDGGGGCGQYRINPAGTHVTFDTLDSLTTQDTNFTGSDVYVRRLR